IVPRRLSFRQVETPLVMRLDGFQDFNRIQAAAFRLGRFGRRLGDFQPRFAGKLGDGVHEAEALALHDKGDDVAMRAAAKAVVAVVVDVEAGGFLAMERAAALPLLARAGELHAAADDARDGNAGSQLIEEAAGQGHCVNMPSCQAERAAFTSGPALDMSSVAACLAFSAAI